MACPLRTLLVLYRMFYIYHVSDMINVWDTVSTFIHLPWMFLLPFFIPFQTTVCIIYNGPPMGGGGKIWPPEWSL